MHTDEAVNAYITGQLLAGESYHYDNRDRHGPALYALALPLARLAGAHNLADLNEFELRLGPVITGTLAVFLFAAFIPEIGLLAAVLAALLWAIAPPVVYYNRYFIHETMFLAATMVLLASGWRMLKSRSIGFGLLTGVAGGLMVACKETAILGFAAAGLALLYGWFVAARIARASNSRPGSPWKDCLLPLIAAGASGLLVVLLCFSWGGTHWQGIKDLAEAAPHLSNRAGGEGHQKPAWYYLHLLGDGWSGWVFLVLALIGSLNILTRLVPLSATEVSHSPTMDADVARRLLVLYTVLICGIYSAIPYKTPWLVLNLWLPLALLAGLGMATLWQLARRTAARWPLLLGALGLLVLMAHDTRLRVFLKPADEHNPYAYAHTGEDLLRLPERMEKLAQTNPAGRNLRIAVVAADPWPLPWYLRHFPEVGYWQPDQNPGPADVYITSLQVDDALSAKLQSWRPEFFGVRPEVLIVLWTPPEPAAATP